MEQIPYLKISAKNNYDLGFQIGKKLSGNIRRRLAACKKLYARMGLPKFSILTKRAMKFLPLTVKYFPDLVKEAEGLSAGAKVKFDELMVLMCEEELIDSKVPKCTSIAIKNKKNILLGHNEDWLKDYVHNGFYILNCRLGSHHSLSLSYMGTLPGSSAGLNSNGLCYTANSLAAERFRYGVPIKFQFRAILDAKNPQAAIKADLTKSSICGNTIYGWKNLRILDIEDFFGHHDTFTSKKFLIHTNHPILTRERTKENTEKESILRYQRAREILEQEKDINLNSLKKILSDHKAKICSHTVKNRLWGVTIASVIMNPQEKWLEVCWSNPCTHKYHRYYL